MKIEKINDNQIRCTLTKEDLADRQIRLSELAYGSEKAKELFKDMIQQANFEFGFEAEDAPLMVEAIPLSAESIILVITKCEYPEELDTRFSKFSEADPDLLGEMAPPAEKKPQQGASDIVDLFKKAYDKIAAASKSEDTQSPQNTQAIKDAKESVLKELQDFARMFEMTELSQAMRLAKVLDGFYHGQSALYKNPQTGLYYLTLHKGSHSPEEFNKVCNIASEYASQRAYNRSKNAFFEEHNYAILKQDAIATLSQLA